MDKKPIDVIVLTFNRTELLHKLLSQLAVQSLTDFNVILADDGSDHLINPNRYPFIRKVIWTQHAGYHRVQRLNEAIAACVSDRLVILDDDCIPIYPRFLEMHITLLNSFDVSRGLIRFPNNTEARWFSCANTGFRTAMLRRIGCFDKNYDGHYGHEDLDLGNSVKKFQLKFSPYEEETCVMHLGEPYANGDRSDAIIGHNTEYFIKKWGYHPVTREPVPPTNADPNSGKDSATPPENVITPAPAG